MRRHLNATKRTHLVTQHDIKLELDVQCQTLIEKALHRAFPHVALLGEEGVAGREDAEYRWVVDPIDGTVNFAYGIPHACVSIALQQRAETPQTADFEDGYQTLVGVVYDPFCDELWTGIRGQAARLNGKVIQVSQRRKLREAIVSIGFAKTPQSLQATLPYFAELAHSVRQDPDHGRGGYWAGVRRHRAVRRLHRTGHPPLGHRGRGPHYRMRGGEFWQKAIPGKHAYRMVASNGLLRRRLRVPNP